MTSRLYLVHDDGRLERVALARWERLVEGAAGPADRLLAPWAGSRAPLLHLVVELVDRSPHQIVHAEGLLVPVRADGRFDRAAWRGRLHRIGDELLPAVADEMEQHRARFRQARYRHEWRWEPEEDVLTAAKREVFRGR